MSNYQSTKLIELGSCAFRQFGATHSHCHLLHGYQLKAKFHFGCSELDSNNWSVDFGGLKQLKQILNDQFDHTLCIAESDPLLEVFQHLHNLGGCNLKIMPGVGIEKTAEWCFNAASQFIKDAYGDRCWVEKVEVFEHENNSAIFSRSDKTTAWKIQEKEPVLLNETQSLQSDTQPVTEAQSQPVPLRNPVSSGYSGLFDNISWGSRR